MAESKKQDRIASEIVGSEVRFIFPTLDGGRVVRCDVAALSPEIQRYGLLHGVKQKLGDAMAIGLLTDASGKVRRATEADKFAALMTVLQRINDGRWNEEREGPTGGILYQAMCRLYPDRWATAADFAEFLDAQATKRGAKRSQVEAALRAQPKVAEAIEAVRAEMGKASGVSGDDILDEIE